MELLVLVPKRSPNCKISVLGFFKSPNCQIGLFRVPKGSFGPVPLLWGRRTVPCCGGGRPLVSKGIFRTGRPGHRNDHFHHFRNDEHNEHHFQDGSGHFWPMSPATNIYGFGRPGPENAYLFKMIIIIMFIMFVMT